MNGRVGRALTLAVLLASSGPPAIAEGIQDDALRALRWESRVLLVFSPGGDDPRARALDRSLGARRCALAERDVVVVRLPEHGEASLGAAPLASAQAARLRRDHAVTPGGFTVVLVGKDGGTKLRTADVPSLDDLFALIDAMPMRRDEMRERGSGCPA